MAAARCLEPLLQREDSNHNRHDSVKTSLSPNLPISEGIQRDQFESNTAEKCEQNCELEVKNTENTREQIHGCGEKRCSELEKSAAFLKEKSELGPDLNSIEFDRGSFQKKEGDLNQSPQEHIKSESLRKDLSEIGKSIVSSDFKDFSAHCKLLGKII